MANISLPNHLIGLPDNRLGLWKWACLRGAGFPAEIVTRLAAPMCISAADHLIMANERVEEKRLATIDFLRSELKQDWQKSKKKVLLQALTRLKKGNINLKAGTLVEFWWQELRAAQESKEAAAKTFRESFNAGILKVSNSIREIVANPRFRRAVLMQNRAALHQMMDSLLVGNPGQGRRGNKERRREELIAKYVQRYCVKNDSIGFFGPVGWLQFNSERTSVIVSPGPDLVSKSCIHFEQWCIEALAETFHSRPAVREWISPRRLPAFYLDGDKLYFPGGTKAVLQRAQLAVLQSCTGDNTASEIAADLLKAPGRYVGSKAEVYEILENFARKGVIAWRFEIPWNSHPETELRKLLEKIGDEQERREALTALNEFDNARRQIADASGDAVELDAQLEKFDLTFHQITGRSTTRNAGQMYSGRTLVYQDCVRDIKMEVGREVLSAIAEPLALILTSARWFTHELAAQVREKCREIYCGMVHKSGRSDLELTPFWLQMQMILEPEGPLFGRLCAELHCRWQKVLSITENVAQVSYASQNLKRLVDEAFPASSCGWELARYNSPDVMIASRSVEAIREGDYSLVLGELHMALNTLRAQCIASQHPSPEEMIQAMEIDMPSVQVVPVAPRSWPHVTARTLFSLTPRHNYHLEASYDSVSAAPRSKTLPISAFVVRDSKSGLTVQTRDSRLRFDFIEFFGEMLSWLAADHLKLVPPSRHIPRILFDRLVVQREQWSFQAAEMLFAREDDEGSRFLDARRWMRKEQLPRFVFARAHVEEKPFYIDFDSPVYVGILAKLARQVLASNEPNRPIVISEMLPTPEQLWLPDRDNQKYTCELRMVFVDQSKMPTVASNDQKLSAPKLPVYNPPTL